MARDPATIPRRDTVDAARAVLIAGVMAFHLTVRWGPPFHPVPLYGFDAGFSPAWQWGRLGVELFFVLTGWVLPDALARAGDAKVFLYRRAARLYPALGACAVLTWIAASFGPAEFRVTGWDLLASLTLMPERFGARFVDGAYWSLAVEVKALLWVAAAWATLGRRFWLGLVALVPLGLLARQADPAFARLADAVLIAPFVGYFLLGLALRWLGAPGQRRAALSCAGLTCAGAGLLACLATQTVLPEHALPERALPETALPETALPETALPESGTGSPILGLAVGFAALALALRVTRPVPLLPGLGRAAYPFYLLHQKIGVILVAGLKAHGLPDAGSVMLAGLGCAGLAGAVHRWVELPAQSWLLHREVGLMAGCRAFVTWQGRRLRPAPACAPPAPEGLSR